MKKILLILTIAFMSINFIRAQEYADLKLTGTHEGTGTFNNAVLPDFTWSVTGALAQEVQILNDEVFDDGNAFENTFGQADYAENLRAQLQENGYGTSGQPITSRATMTIDFDDVTPGQGWGFCVVDIDVENLLISAIDENDNIVPAETVNGWLVELFDANLIENGEDLPKWDGTHAALLGSCTPNNYIVYDSLVIGGMPDSEAPAAFFLPDIPLKSLILVFENLQDIYKVSYHFYIGSESASAVEELTKDNMVIFPNPAVSVVSLQWPQGAFGVSQQPSTVGLFDLHGRKLLEKNIPAESETVQLDISSLQNGLYLCRLQTETGNTTKKVMIQK